MDNPVPFSAADWRLPHAHMPGSDGMCNRRDAVKGGGAGRRCGLSEAQHAAPVERYPCVSFPDARQVETARCRRGDPPCQALLVFDLPAVFSSAGATLAFYELGWARIGHEGGRWNRDQEWVCPQHRP